MFTSKPKLIVAASLALGVAALAASDSAAERKFSVAALPPVVVATSPQSGDTAVDPVTSEIRVTFSKKMTDKSWSWSQVSGDTFPEVAGDIRYAGDEKTCILPVKLAAQRTYVIWLNSEKFQGFKDADGHAAVPYLLVFETR